MNSRDDFEFLQLLGKGGFGYVYQALHRKTGKQVAVKMINKRKIKEAGMLQRVRKEIEIQQQLQHPSILELHGFFEDDNYVYLVTELCEGGELYRFLQQKRRRPDEKLGCLSEPEARGLMIQVVNGLLFLQSKGILHRDLKLSNLLLTKSLDVKIADFGLAVQLSQMHSSEQKTMCGTPNFVSPEMLSRQPYGLASDVWALGCLFYTLLCGRTPFESDEVKETLMKVQKAEYEIPGHVSEEARDLITKMLRKNPNDRIPLAFILSDPFFKLPQSKLIDYRQNKTEVEDKENMLPTKSCLKLINTNRLKPLNQETKYGLVEILPTGDLLLNFNQDKYKILISGNGETLSFLDKYTNERLKTYTTKEIIRSESLSKKYKYGQKFVEMVQSKTVKVSYQSPYAKCSLMENGPQADFEAIFLAQKIRLKFFPARQELEIKPISDTLSMSVSSNRSRSSQPITLKGRILEDHFQLPREYKDLWNHARECYAKCLKVSDSDLYTFPVVLKSGHTSIAPSIVEDFSDPENMVGSISRKGEGLSRLTINTIGTGFTSTPDKKTFNSQKSETLYYDRPPVSPPKITERFKHINGLGWCFTKYVNGTASVFTVLFHDGVRMVIEPPAGGQINSNCVVVLYSADKVERFPISKQLPQSVKERLAHFPKFVTE
ncbi:hypothetical protein MP638_003395 [Amoeboaphelidium occidentale]|nr:hypothetical protein MP638_003395 [Amoeboaphelidium occidentale]